MRFVVASLLAILLVGCAPQIHFNRTSESWERSLPTLEDRVDIPYVGSTLDVGGRELTVPKIFEIAGEVWNKVNLAFYNHMKVVGDSLLLDLQGLKKAVKDVHPSVDSLNKGRVEDIFSAICIRLPKGKGFEPKFLDLLKIGDKDSTLIIDDDSFVIDLKPEIRDSKISFDKEIVSNVNASFVLDVKVKKNENEVSLISSFDSLVFDFPGITAEKTKEWHVCVKNDHLKVSITKENLQYNVDLCDYIPNYYMSINEKLDSLKDAEIPLLGKPYFSRGNEIIDIEKLIDIIDKYSMFLSVFTDESLDVEETVPGGKLYIERLKKWINFYIDERLPLVDIALVNKSLDAYDNYDSIELVDLKGGESSKKAEPLQMHEQENTLVYKISSDMLKYAKKVDFGLQNVEMLDVHFDAYVKNVFHIFKGYVIADFCYLDQLDFKFTAPVSSGTLNYRMLFNVGFLRNDRGFFPTLEIVPDSSAEGAGHIRYDFVEKKWK